MSRRAGPAAAEATGRERVNSVYTIDDIARVIHEANSALQAINGEPVNPRWDEAPDWQRWSCVEGVRDALEGLTPEEHHEAWVQTMRTEGWRHGPVKDAAQKTHPWLVPYAELPPQQRAKTELFLAIVATLRAADRPD